MIIRSQDKKHITTDMNLEVVANKYYPEGDDRDVTEEAKIYTSVGLLIGTYSTEAKAIKVLDMICTEYVNALSVKQGEVVMNVLDYPKMFNMPQDEKVEV